MATAGSAERPGRPASAACRSRPGSRPATGHGAACSLREDELKKCGACAEVQPGGSPPCGHPDCPLYPARSSGSEERLRRRSDPERSSSRPGSRDCDSRREFFVCPADVSSNVKHKLLLSEDRDDFRRRNSHICKDESETVRRDEEPGVLSDSENEEPISRRIRNISAFVRKTKTLSAISSGCQRSQSCTDPVEDRAGKLKMFLPPPMMDRVGISYSFTAGILLSSENSRSVSAPVSAPDRRLTWRTVMTSSSTPLGPERSISPESNDSISEELNHFKPIVCSPCTPPKRLPDGQLMEPTIVKSTPRNLTRGMHKATSYEASPAVLQKWRQIELDRQSLKVNSKATLTSPVSELHEAAKTHHTLAGDAVVSVNKRKLLFDPPTGDIDGFQKQSVKIWVPAIRYSGEAALRGDSDFEPGGGAPESGGGGTLFSQKQSFSPYTNNSGFQSCKLVPKDSQSPRKESDNQSTSRRGKKRNRKTKHLDLSRDADQVQQDRELALKLQRQFDLENQTATRRRSPDKYFLRSWMSNQNRRRRGLRRSRRINKKH